MIRDMMRDGFGWVVLVSLAAVLSLVGYLVWLEVAHPCQRYGDPYKTVMYVQSGKVLVPVPTTTRDCLERAP